MKKFLLLSAICLLLLAGCGESNAEIAEPAAPEATPEPTPYPYVNIGGRIVRKDLVYLDLKNMTYDCDTLLSVADEFENVKKIEFGSVSIPYEEFAALCEAFPNAEVTYNVKVNGEVCDLNVKNMDLSAMSIEEIDELVGFLPYYTSLEEINFVNEEGVCVYTVDDIEHLDRVREAAPGAKFKVSFELFGQTVTSEDERIEYFRVPIGNEGAEKVRAVLPYLTNCTYFLMDGCNIDNEILAQMREDFPQTKIVWRVWLVNPDYNNARKVRQCSLLTDTYRVRTVFVRNENCHLLNYCNETKYMDVGHTQMLTDFSFLQYMPDLEVAIFSITGFSDLSTLDNCQKLEYLEFNASHVTDLSPLASHTALRHLNASFIRIDDITPIYGLELERFRTVSTFVPYSQIAEFQSLHPDCDVLLGGIQASEGGWRYINGREAPRYALLRQQMEYDIDFSYGIP